MCNMEMTPCDYGPCHNGAECQLNGHNSYICKCLPGFQGNLCQDRIDVCFSQPCYNGATCEHCIEPECLTEFRCICDAGFKGESR